MLPAFRPPPPPLGFDVDGEVVDVLARTARRDASDAAFAEILRLERRLVELGENIEWREAHVGVRARRWVRSRMLFTAIVTAAILSYSFWLRYTDAGRLIRIDFVDGLYQNESPGPALWDEPHWLTADMTTARIRELIAEEGAEKARAAARIVP